MNINTLHDAIHMIETCVGKKFEAGVTDGWMLVFADVTDEEFTPAFAKYMREQMTGFLPVPADIRRIIVELSEAERLRDLPTVTDAVSEIRSYSGFALPKKFSHPLIMDCVENLGFETISNMNGAEQIRVIGHAYGEMRKEYIASGSRKYYKTQEQQAIEAQEEEDAKRLDTLKRLPYDITKKERIELGFRREYVEDCYEYMKSFGQTAVVAMIRAGIVKPTGTRPEVDRERMEAFMKEFEANKADHFKMLERLERATSLKDITDGK